MYRKYSKLLGTYKLALWAAPKGQIERTNVRVISPYARGAADTAAGVISIFIVIISNRIIFDHSY